jgi:hypothetical protein
MPTPSSITSRSASATGTPLPSSDYHRNLVPIARPGGDGGAFNIQGSFARFVAVQVANNAARGGGIYLENGSMSLEFGTAIGDNIATISGGGVFLTSASANLGANVAIQNNFPNDIRCVMSSFNGGIIGTSSCLNCGACTTP